MPDLLLFIIGCFVTLLVGTAVVMIAVQDAQDRKRSGRPIDDPIDEIFVSSSLQSNDARQHESSRPAGQPTPKV